MKSLYQSDIFLEYIFQFTVQASIKIMRTRMHIK